MVLRQNVRTLLHTGRWTLARAWRAERWLTLGVAIFTVAASIVPALQLWVGRGLINAIFAAIAERSTTAESILLWLAANSAVILLQLVVMAVRTILIDRLNARLELALNLQILRHATTLDLAYFEDAASQDTLARMQENVSVQVSGFVVNALNILSQIVQSASLVAVLLLIDPIGVLAMSPLVAAYMVYQWRYIRRKYQVTAARATQRRWARYFVGRLTSADSMPEVKLLGLAPLFVDRYAALQEAFVAEDRQLRERHSLITFALDALFTAAYVTLWGLQIPRVLAGSLLPGDWIMYGRTLLQLQQSTRVLGDSSGSLLNQMLYVTALEEFLAAEPATPSGAEPPPAGQGAGVAFEHVTFSYAGSAKTALDDVSFTVAPGEFVAIVGENGAGKSTLVKLLMRLYPVSAGRITLNGVDIQRIDIDAYYRHIAYLPQHISRYEASAAENIAYGDWSRLHTQPALVHSAAERANAADMIAAMPQGYDTLLGRRFGVYDLSGGQWQRLAIARTLARDAHILIWDEPTSNLDVKAESSLLAHLREIGAGRTTFFISHRFTNMQLADRIIVLANGSIVESGTHDGLLAKQGYYAQLYALHRQQTERGA